MKILTIAGTRPEYLRLVETMKKLDKFFDHKFIWTAQNFESCLSTQFFKEFDYSPHTSLLNNDKLRGVGFIGWAMGKLEELYNLEKPNVILVLGDTNSVLAAVYVAKRLNIPIMHMEAGNRCFDSKRVPEEINRYVIDSIADWHLCYTQRSKEHLLLEGKHPSKIVVVGNPITEVLKKMGNEKLTTKDYYLATIHRKENLSRIIDILMELDLLGKKVIIPLHPTFKSKLDLDGMYIERNYKNIEFIEPTNFSEFLKLEKEAICVITDSGTVPEECYILGVPCVLIRYSTERPELLENNAMVLCPNLQNIRVSIREAIGLNSKAEIIDDYSKYAANNVVKLVSRCAI